MKSCPRFCSYLLTIAAAVMVLTCVALLATPVFAGSVPNPTVTGPIAAPDIPGTPTRNYTFFSTNHDLATHGYVEEEFFFSGTANRYNTSSPPSGEPCPTCTATVISSGNPYKTRMVVRRPADPRNFNGTVLVEWYNVTNGFDAENDWFFSWEHILRAGYIWVGISAQRVGVNALKTWSPSRYGTLDVTAGGTITDDSLCYDIFSQAGQAVLNPSGVDPLNGMRPRVILAMGESQSAFRLAAYANSIQPLANLYEGILLQSSLGNPIRTDLNVPVWKLLTEYDVANSEAIVRQPNTDIFRSWEVAGTSHVDQHLRASREPLELRDNLTSTEAALAPTCANPNLGTRVPTTYVAASVYDHFTRWVKDGVSPPIAPYIDIATFGSPGVPSVIARNSLDIALGGIQLAQVAVPRGLNYGIGTGPGACVRWGPFTPFTITELDQLYPSHDDYVDQVTRVSHGNVWHGYILQPDAEATIRCAAYSNVGASRHEHKETHSQEDLYCKPYF